MKKFLLFLLLLPMFLSATMVPTKVFITLPNGKVTPAIKYESDKGYIGQAPLIVYLSGKGQTLITNVTQSGIDAAYRAMASGSQLNAMALAEQQGFKVIVILFVLEWNGWQADFSGGYFQEAAADYAVANMNVDPARLCVGGWSSGGNGTWYAITSSLKLAKRWAAAFVISSGGVDAGYENARDAHVPVWVFHSQDDGAVSIGTGTTNVNRFKATNPNPAPIFTVLPSGGHAGAMQYALTYKPLFEWLASKRNINVSDPGPDPDPEPEPVKTIYGRIIGPKWEVIIYDDGTTETKY